MGFSWLRQTAKSPNGQGSSIIITKTYEADDTPTHFLKDVEGKGNLSQVTITSLKSDSSSILENGSTTILPTVSPKRRWPITQKLLNYPHWKRWLILTTIMLLTTLILATSLSLTLAKPTKPKGPTVDLGYSKVEGNTLNGVNEWLGIRYAEPPTKDLRWKAPQAPKKTKGVQETKKVSSYAI